MKKLLILIIAGSFLGLAWCDNENQTPNIRLSPSRSEYDSTINYTNQNLKYHDEVPGIMPRYDRGFWGNDYSLRRNFLIINNVMGE